MKSKIIAWFSCGITSAVACKLALDQYGPENVRVIYIEIDTAHPYNETFIADCERWYGVKVERTRSKIYKDQFDVIEKTRFINGPYGAACSKHLKKEVRQMIELQPFKGQVFGFEFTPKEVNRAVRFQQQHPTSRPLFPLIDRQMTKEQAADILLKNGIALPPMYELGFHNNNCIGCTKGGMGYWNLIQKSFPEVFLKMARLEREIGRSCINGVFLDELKPDQGREQKPILPNCGAFCEVEFEDLIDKNTQAILDSKIKIGQLSLF